MLFLLRMRFLSQRAPAKGFRQFEIKDKKVPLRVKLMEDLVDLKPFQAANKTSLFVLEKGQPTSYPIPVVIWKRHPGIGAISTDWPLSKVLANTERIEVKAIPVDPSRINSSWQTATLSCLKYLEKMKGEYLYKAYRGASTEPYGVFWLRIKEVRPDGLLVVENMAERGKREIPSTSAAIERDLVYPAVSGGDIIKFGIKSHFYVLVAQDPVERKGYEEQWMSSHFPLTFAYLTHFKEILIKRAAYQKYFHKEIKKDNKVIKREPIAPFYSMYNISEDSFAKYRVVWKRMASKMTAVVLSRLRTQFGLKTAISTDTTSFFSVEDEKEAHYLCGILNSDVVDEYIRSFSSAGRGFGAPSVMNNLAIPKFTGHNKIHIRISELSQKAHALVAQGKEIEKLQEDLNDAVERLWNIKF